ncbi:competence protein ComEC [Williamsoniiplasma somnilux]|uniref:Competence protein ComEC n=1 Tax=Williamsoniiplasma somnilux TaxID=215578 RepID=A0A2K8NYA1_9MOLU|nr:ComEC/Rec2 family competence protein [Williamsoniiplasma somnilux]ATZ18767.1 competence protein ComEC [Williamsoniiplasma somnilux]
MKSGDYLNNVEVTAIKSTNSYLIVKYNNTYFYLNIFNNTHIVGQKFNISGTIGAIDSKQNFFNFDFQNYLWTQNIHQQVIDYKIDAIETNNIIFLFNKYIVKKFNNELIQKFIFHNYLPGDLKNTFNSLGISYLLNLSGLNIFLISVFLNKTIFRFKKNIYLKMVIDVFLFFYLFLLKFPLIITRVFFGIYINNFGYLKKIKISKITKNCIIIVLLVFVQPLFFLNITFIFLLVTLIFFDSKNNNSNWKFILINLLKATMIFIPLQIYYDWKWHVFDEFFQLLISPFVFVCYFLTFLFWWLPNVETFFIFLKNVLINYVHLFSYIDICWNIGHLSPFLIFLYYLFLYALLKYKKYLILRIAIFCSFTIFILFLNRLFLPEEILTMVNVGNGQSIIYINKVKHVTILFDVGNGQGFGKTNAADLLRYWGINDIDYVFISHNHEDHYNGINKIKEEFHVKNIIKRENTQSEWNINGLILKTFKLTKQKDENDNSRLIILMTGKSNIFISGDLTKVGEQQFINDTNFQKLIKSLNIDLMIIGHHGSKTSSSDDWIKLINPLYAFISGTDHNNLHFPNSETLETLKNNNIQYWISQNIHNWTLDLQTKSIFDLK